MVVVEYEYGYKYGRVDGGVDDYDEMDMNYLFLFMGLVCFLCLAGR